MMKSDSALLKVNFDSILIKNDIHLFTNITEENTVVMFVFTQVNMARFMNCCPCGVFLADTSMMEVVIKQVFQLPKRHLLGNIFCVVKVLCYAVLKEELWLY